MDSVEFLSVQDFAKRAGVSTQAVYARFDSLDKSLTKKEKGKKYLSTDALGLFSTIEANKKPSNREEKTYTTEQVLQMQIDSLKEQLALCKEQLAQNALQLAEKDKQIASRDRQIDNLTVSTQYLIAEHSKNSSSAGSDSESKEESSDTVPPPPTTQAEQAPPEEKHGLFWRLFH